MGDRHQYKIDDVDGGAPSTRETITRVHKGEDLLLIR